ncbi:MAG: hypothetical protein ACYC2O_09905 [Microthrixaceae bacterium]
MPSPAPRAPLRGHASRRTRRTAGALLLAVVGLAALVAACTPDRDRPARVTMPEHSSTTTVPPTLAPGGGASGSAAPEPPTPAWVVQVGGTGDDTLDAVTGAQRSVVAVGSTTAGIDRPTSGGTDVLAVTVSTEGELESTEQFGSTGDDAAAGVSAAQDSVVACGSTTGVLGSGSGGSSDVWCTPIPAAGAVQQLGGAEEEHVSGVSFPADTDADASPALGGVSGYASGRIDGFFPGAEDPAGRGLGLGDALAFRIASDGSALWARQFGTAAEDAATAVRDVDGAGIFVGYTDGDLEGPSAGARDGWISHIDASGVQRWITQFGSTGSDELLAVDAAGEARRGDQSFVGVGRTDGDIDGSGPRAPSGGTDAFVAAFATNGSLLWSTQLGSAGDDVATAVSTDGTTVFVAGTTRTGSADPDDPTSSPTGLGDLDPVIGPGGAGDVVLAALDASTGEVHWVQRYGSAADERVTGMTTTEDGLLVISGTTLGQVADTPPGGSVDGFLMAFPLPSSGGGAASSV